MLIKHLLELAAALFFLVCLIGTVRSVVRARRRDLGLGGDDPFLFWKHNDGYDAGDVSTRDDIPAVPAAKAGSSVVFPRQGQAGSTGMYVDPRQVPATLAQPATDAGQPPAMTYSPEPDTLIGEVVAHTDWRTAMTIPAPPIRAVPTAPELAEEWIAAFERGEVPQPDEFSRRMLAASNA